MTDATSDPRAPLDLIQARRIELVDDLGTPRIAIGNVAQAVDDDYWPGLVIRSPEGRDRVSLMLHHDGADLEFEMAGNRVAILGVIDADDESPESAVRLALCDANGTPVIGWWVYADGTWERLGPRR